MEEKISRLENANNFKTKTFNPERSVFLQSEQLFPEADLSESSELPEPGSWNPYET
jgi:hypothetical protein